MILTWMIVDVFPFLRFVPKWLPGIKFHKVGEKGRSLAEDLRMKPIKEIQSQMVCAYVDIYQFYSRLAGIVRRMVQLFHLSHRDSYMG